jgi:hypothetical protein
VRSAKDVGLFDLVDAHDPVLGRERLIQRIQRRPGDRQLLIADPVDGLLPAEELGEAVVAVAPVGQSGEGEEQRGRTSSCT